MKEFLSSGRKKRYLYVGQPLGVVHGNKNEHNNSY